MVQIHQNCSAQTTFTIVPNALEKSWKRFRAIVCTPMKTFSNKKQFLLVESFVYSAIEIEVICYDL